MNMSSIYRFVYPSLIWNFPSEQKKLYLTFDDGPVPGITDWVLDTLKQYDAAATFFCIGDNVRKHPEIFQRLLSSGHSIGNHTMNHLNGWKTTDKEYIENVNSCRRFVQSSLFR